MHRINLTLVVATLFAALTGCSGESGNTPVAQSSVVAQGEAIVNRNCKVCHAQGINGAPVIGNKKMWSKRIAKGEDQLVSSAMNGFGLMPAKGGKDHLTEEEIRLAVKYFISKASE